MIGINSLMLAQVSGEAVVHTLLYVVILGVVFWLLWWLVSYLAPPEPFAKVARAILAIAAVIVLISVLMGMAGHPIIRW